MAISIYYTARRKVPLSAAEILIVKEIVSRHSVDDQIEQRLITSSGLNWESFDFTVNAESSGFFKKGIVLSGSTKLPDNQEDATWVGVQHWCNCLSAIRTSLLGCEWHVTVEDHKIQWDEKAGAYDPSQ